MAHDLKITDGTREEKYIQLLPVIRSLMEIEADDIANMANVSAVIKKAFDFHWVGFYRTVGKELLLGPFQGPLACTRIPFGKGVCGTAWEKRESIIVSDVEDFPGHIACSSLSKSEITVPIFRNEKVIYILDIDSIYPNDFTSVDMLYLNRMADFFKR